MNYFMTMLQLWCLLIVCVVVGRRFVNLLPHVMQRTIGFYIAPILGLAFFLLLATLYGWLLPFRWYYSIPLTLLLVVLSIVYEHKKRELFIHSGYVCLFGLVCALPIFAPIIRYGAYNPFTDIFTYLAQSQWLQEHSFTDKVVLSGHYPMLTQIALYQTTGLRMGGTFFLGFVQSLLKLQWSYYAYIPMISLGFVTGCLAVGSIIRQIIPVRKIVILALALMPSFLANGFVFGAEWGFFPQTYGLAFATGLFALLPALVSQIQPDRWTRIARCVFPLSICTAALLFAYNEPFPIFALAIGVFICITMVQYPHKIKSLLMYMGVYAIAVLILINHETIRIVQNAYQTLTITQGATAPIGWPVPWSPEQFISSAFGLKSFFTSARYSLDFWVSTVLGPIFLIVLFITLIKFVRAKSKQHHSKQRRSALLLLFCIELILFLLFIKFRYFSPSAFAGETGYTFIQFKLMKYAAPFSAALMGVFGAILWHYRKKQRVLWMCIYGVIFILGIFYHLRFVSSNLTEHFLASVQQRRAPFDVLLNLRKAVADIPADQVIYIDIGAEQHKLRQMIAYILYDRKIASDYSDDAYMVGLSPQDIKMPINKANWLLMMKQPLQKDCGKSTLSSGPFVLMQAPFNYIVLEKQEGGIGIERNDTGDVWSWVAHAIDFHYRILGKPKSVRFQFELNTNPHAVVQLYRVELRKESGAVLARYRIPMRPGKQKFISPWIKLQPKQQQNKVTLHVETDGKPVRLGEHDPREVTFAISNTALCNR